MLLPSTSQLPPDSPIPLCPPRSSSPKLSLFLYFTLMFLHFFVPCYIVLVLMGLCRPWMTHRCPQCLCALPRREGIYIHAACPPHLGKVKIQGAGRGTISPCFLFWLSNGSVQLVPRKGALFLGLFTQRHKDLFIYFYFLGTAHFPESSCSQSYLQRFLALQV